MTNPQIHLVQLQKALIPVSKMVIKFGLQCHEFKDNIEMAYIQAAKELIKEENREVTNQAIAVKTGIDRRKVAASKQSSNNNKGFNKMDLVVLALQKCKGSGQKSLSSARLRQIIDGIYGHHIRANAVINELIHAEMISPEESRFRITDALHQKLSMQAELADEVDVTTQRLFETFFKKMFSENETTLNQMTVKSGKIPPRKHQSVEKLIQQAVTQFQQDIEQILASHEVNVPENTYPQIGISQFQFNDSKDDSL